VLGDQLTVKSSQRRPAEPYHYEVFS